MSRKYTRIPEHDDPADALEPCDAWLPEGTNVIYWTRRGEKPADAIEEAKDGSGQ